MDAETHELIAAYALDALDGDERARAKEVLATSEEAREELRLLTEVAAAMATAAVVPSSRMRRSRASSAPRGEPVAGSSAWRRALIAPGPRLADSRATVSPSRPPGSPVTFPAHENTRPGEGEYFRHTYVA